MWEEAAILRAVLLLGLVSYSLSESKWNATANLNTKWVCEERPRIIDSAQGSVTSTLMVDFLSTWTVEINGAVSCGLFCTGSSCMFSIYAYYARPEISVPEWSYSPRVLWSASRNRTVQRNSTVEFGSDGNLVLFDGDGSKIWATETSNKGAVTLSLDSSANLLLLDSSKRVVWQSFDHPTNVLLPGQIFKRGMRLIAPDYDGVLEGSFVLEMQEALLVLYALGSPQQPYWNDFLFEDRLLYSNTSLGSRSVFATDTPSFHYLQLEADGNVQVHAMLNTWTVAYDLYRTSGSSCMGAGTCGSYGVCVEGQCSCLQFSSALGSLDGDAFSLINSSIPKLGCRPSKPLSNGSAQHMVQLTGIDYFAASFSNGEGEKVKSGAECKQNCLEDPFCKFSVFVTETERDVCHSFDRVYTFRTSSDTRNLVFIKMENAQQLIPPDQKDARPLKKRPPWVIPLIISSSLFGILFTVLTAFLIFRKRLLNPIKLQSLPGLPEEFSYRQLQICTKHFSKTLGKGGFGTVYFGQLPSGISIAVKKLASAVQGQKQFEAEVCTIGSIHHVNLVKLQGYCAEGDQRLLVYEFMPNGSLDQWIFHGGDKLLDWATRYSIFLGTAKGLAYLHDECRERIIHLDIKPHNILLDEQFVAKVADFGLSKLVDKDQSEIMTTMRGTPGYLAPEWLHSRITEKADVYSYGILLLEIVCGRKCIDYKCEDSDKVYLPAWVNEHVSKGSVLEVIDVRLEGAFDDKEAMRAVNVGLWCIQDDASVRPSMATVIEMLKGVSDASDPPIVHSNKLTSVFFDFVHSSSAVSPNL